MKTIYRDNADRLSVADAKRLILKTLPPETSVEVYARVDENGEIDFEGPVDLKEVHGVQIYAGFIDRDFLPICEQLKIQPRMKYRPVFTDYNGDVSRDTTYTIAHDEFVGIAELFGLLVVTGEAPEPQATTPSAAPKVEAPASAAGKAEIAPGNWKMKIQAEAASRFERLRASGASPTVYSILDDMAKWCRDNGVKTDGAIYPSSGYLRTHVLGGKHWTPPI